ncbi:MAG: hypothetical protein M3Z75_17930 [Actinomycetota bacterium]|nr:hypothetical protein [Actinomycetota bacterium]
MGILILGAKSAVAVMLLVAGGAKLADLASFAATVRLFVPRGIPSPLRGAMAFCLVAVEVVLGGVSLSFPAVKWLNLVIFALTIGFVVVSVVGFLFYRGRSCRCFGALSQRKFDVAEILRSIGIAALAAIAMLGVQSASVGIDVAARVLLLIAATLLALAAFTAAGALAVSRETQPRLASK